MKISGDILKVRKAVLSARGRSKRIALVPTMGALHLGHLSLIKAAKKECGFVLVSIFVNPKQFGKNEDLSRYPRPFEKDVELLKKAKVDFIFHPQISEMYEEDFSTFIDESQISLPLCGALRPGHFRGVCTVVAKLFNIVSPDIAYFGAKDYQQALVIKRMARDLNFPLEVKVLPTFRETDGLAMSSRNVYLNSTQRKLAPILSKALNEAQRMILVGQRNPANVEATVKKILLGVKDLKIDYAKVLDAKNLEPIAAIRSDVVIALAVYLGNTRLIDNIVVKIL